MKKKLFKISNLALIFVVGLMLTGCGNKEVKIETEKLTHDDYKYKFTVEVPKEKGYKLVKKLEKENKYAMDYPDIILDGDKVQLFFKNTTFVYQTSLTIQKKYPDMDKKNPNFDDFLKYNDLGFTEKDLVDLNGSRAIKVKAKYGPADNYKLVGYRYYVEKKDSKEYVYMMILPKNEEDDIKELMKDPEVKVIVDSLKFTSK